MNSTAETELKASQATTAAGGKTRLEKTQSMLTIASTSVGLLGVIGSVFTYAAATFYTGTVELQPPAEMPGIVVKVYTREGHESIFHSKHLELMPGEYHLEVTSPEGKAVHLETKVEFHKTNTIPVEFGRSSETAPPVVSTKKHWWQFWRHSADEQAKEQDQNDQDKNDQDKNNQDKNDQFQKEQ